KSSRDEHDQNTHHGAQQPTAQFQQMRHQRLFAIFRRVLLVTHLVDFSVTAEASELSVFVATCGAGCSSSMLSAALLMSSSTSRVPVSTSSSSLTASLVLASTLSRARLISCLKPCTSTSRSSSLVKVLA